MIAKNYPERVVEHINEAEINFSTGRFVNAGNIFSRAASGLISLDLGLDALYFMYRAADAYKRGGDKSKLARVLGHISQTSMKQSFVVNSHLMESEDDMKLIENAIYNSIITCLRTRDFDGVNALAISLVEVHEKLLTQRLDFERQIFYLERQKLIAEHLFDDQLKLNATRKMINAIRTMYEKHRQSFIDNELKHHYICNHLTHALVLSIAIDDKQARKLMEYILQFPPVVIPFEKYKLPQMGSLHQFDEFINRDIEADYQPQNYLIDVRSMAKNEDGIIPVQVIEDLIDKIDEGNEEIYLILDEASANRFDQPFYFDAGIKREIQIIRVSSEKNYKRYVNQVIADKNAYLVTHDADLHNHDNEFYRDAIRSFCVIANSVVLA